MKTQLQIFSKNFPLKEQLSIIDIENYFKELEPSSRKLLSEVGKFLELVLVLMATKGGFKSEETGEFFRCQNKYSKSLS